MSRADRGIERVDIPTQTVLLGGRGGNPKNVGLSASKNNFAPRIGMIYRMNENTVFRTGYGITYNPIGWSRPIRGFYPATIANFLVNNETFQPYGSINQGIPFFTGPDLSSGRVPLPPTVDMRTPEPGNIDRGTLQSWNLFVERRLPARSRSISATSGPRATAAMRTSTSTRRTHRWRQRSPSDRNQRTQPRPEVLGTAPEDEVSRSATRREPAVHQGSVAQGCLHLEQGDEHRRDEDGWTA